MVESDWIIDMFYSEFHEEMATVEWLPLQVSDKPTDDRQFMGPSYLILSPEEYERFMDNDEFDFTTRDYTTLAFHKEPLEALAFGARQ